MNVIVPKIGPYIFTSSSTNSTSNWLNDQTCTQEKYSNLVDTYKNSAKGSETNNILPLFKLSITLELE